MGARSSNVWSVLETLIRSPWAWIVGGLIVGVGVFRLFTLDELADALSRVFAALGAAGGKLLP